MRTNQEEIVEWADVVDNEIGKLFKGYVGRQPYTNEVSKSLAYCFQ